MRGDALCSNAARKGRPISGRGLLPAKSKHLVLLPTGFLRRFRAMGAHGERYGRESPQSCPAEGSLILLISMVGISKPPLSTWVVGE